MVHFELTRLHWQKPVSVLSSMAACQALASLPKLGRAAMGSL